jgi:hypothetical protein
MRSLKPTMTQLHSCAVSTPVLTFLARLSRGNSQVQAGTIALSSIHRRLLDLSLAQEVRVVPFRTTEADIYLSSMRVDVDFLSKTKKGSYWCLACHRLEPRGSK